MAGEKERRLGDGTTRRFLLLIFLLVVSSYSLLYEVASQWRDRTGYRHCMSAAVTGPDGKAPFSGDAEVLAFGHRAEACEHALLYPAFLQALGGTILVLLATFVLYRMIPRWRWRGSRLRTVSPVAETELHDDLCRLCERAGLTRRPRFAVDPRALSAGAAVFGTGRRATVCLHAGLLVRRSSDPRQFEAVVLHELAHVANADAGLGYASVALGRVFLIAVLLPYLFFECWLLSRGHVPGSTAPLSAEQSPKAKDLLFAVMLVFQVQWARADILRHRELFADKEAVGWGADPEVWRAAARTAARRAGSPLLRPAHWISLPWRTHPGRPLRARSLERPWLGNLTATVLAVSGILSLVYALDESRQLGFSWPLDGPLSLIAFVLIWATAYAAKPRLDPALVAAVRERVTRAFDDAVERKERRRKRRRENGPR
ncbi:M48 family metalloprotease [Streptomyces sp. NRRL F-5126]|uniref:M48 family metalloprotease n=1 Tax=Streptomyces sp. NRRL F-5126 TaxID=1463857 RepID=UPI0004CC674F|nr:M48 family metalloprotease [Streptomyces sp. NRRL F-5126]